MVMLWAIGESLVKSTVTLPAFASSELLSNFSWPPGSAAITSDEDALPEPDDELEPEVVVADGVEVAAVVSAAAGADSVVVLVLFDELPHPATASASSASAGRMVVRLRSDVAR